MNNTTILVNVDESAISNSTKTNYSWGPKGISQSISSINIRGSISIVTAILSCGLTITGIRKGTVRSSTFIEYIKHLLSI